VRLDRLDARDCMNFLKSYNGYLRGCTAGGAERFFIYANHLGLSLGSDKELKVVTLLVPKYPAISVAVGFFGSAGGVGFAGVVAGAANVEGSIDGLRWSE
jgi:hypothetical protein